MNARHLAFAMLLAVAAVAPAQAAPETYDSAKIRLTPPTGWVRFLPKQATAWAAPDDPKGQKCVVALTFTQFDANPSKSFDMTWKSLSFVKQNSLPLPTPTIQSMPGTYTIAHGTWSGRLPSGQPYAYSVANVSRAQAGQAVAGMGGDPTCMQTFSKVVKSIVIIDDEVPLGPANGSNNMAANMGQFYSEQNSAQARIAAQQRQDQQTQDRLAQQRAVEQQNQARIHQQRITDSYNNRR